MKRVAIDDQQLLLSSHPMPNTDNDWSGVIGTNNIIDHTAASNHDTHPPIQSILARQLLDYKTLLSLYLYNNPIKRVDRNYYFFGENYLSSSLCSLLSQHMPYPSPSQHVFYPVNSSSETGNKTITGISGSFAFSTNNTFDLNKFSPPMCQKSLPSFSHSLPLNGNFFSSNALSASSTWKFPSHTSLPSQFHRPIEKVSESEYKEPAESEDFTSPLTVEENRNARSAINLSDAHDATDELITSMAKANKFQTNVNIKKHVKRINPHSGSCHKCICIGGPHSEKHDIFDKSSKRSTSKNYSSKLYNSKASESKRSDEYCHCETNHDIFSKSVENMKLHTHRQLVDEDKCTSHKSSNSSCTSSACINITPCQISPTDLQNMVNVEKPNTEGEVDSKSRDSREKEDCRCLCWCKCYYTDKRNRKGTTFKKNKYRRLQKQRLDKERVSKIAKGNNTTSENNHDIDHAIEGNTTYMHLESGRNKIENENTISTTGQVQRPFSPIGSQDQQRCSWQEADSSTSTCSTMFIDHTLPTCSSDVCSITPNSVNKSMPSLSSVKEQQRDHRKVARVWRPY